MCNIDLSFDKKHIWHPYSSMVNPIPCYPVKSAYGENIILENGQVLIDGMSSWWASVHGYNHPILNQAIYEQVKKMSHVMFGGFTHQPAIDLCKRIVALLPSNLECVFLADSGSVAVEVGLKMAIQYWKAKGENRSKFVAFKNAYHGDTFGAMSVCDPQNSMHSIFNDLLQKHYFAESPKSRYSNSWIENDMDSLKYILENNYKKIAAVIIEPIVQGAGGMKLYHPEYLRQLRQLCDKFGVLLIADEIATGFGRTGKWFACEHSGISPDIICIGKALTGGYMTLSATVTTEHIAKVISQGESNCFMHGPTYMANPLACSVAIASIDLLLSSEALSKVKQIETELKYHLLPLKDYCFVVDIRVLGAIGVIEMEYILDIAKTQKYFVELGVWIRPFGKLIYIMPPYIISKSNLKLLCNAIKEYLENQFL